MCELFCVSARVPTRLTISLDEFAQHGGGTGPHHDGWGVAFYEGRDVRVFRQATAAHNSPWVRCLREEPTYSNLILSHIRKATFGARTLANTQPFARELGGRMHVFAHNGDVPAVKDDPRFPIVHFRPLGETDSEHAFCALLSRLSSIWLRGDAPPSIGDRRIVFSDFCNDLRSLGPANLLYSDGELLFAHGHRRTQATNTIEPPGLWTLERECRLDQSEFKAPGLQIEAFDQQVVLCASIPLSDEDWRPLADGEIIIMTNGELLRLDGTGH